MRPKRGWIGSNGVAMAMTDDLPRTLRREREARERAGLTGNGHSGSLPPLGSGGQQPTAFSSEPSLADGFVVSGTTVTDVRIPFIRLMLFCLKLVFAAIPALVLLGVILWLAGHAMMTWFPWLVKLQILIRVP